MNRLSAWVSIWPSTITPTAATARPSRRRRRAITATRIMAPMSEISVIAPRVSLASTASCAATWSAPRNAAFSTAWPVRVHTASR